MSIKVTGRIIHSEKEGEEGEFQRYGKDDNDFNLSISRLELNKYLISRAEKSGAKIIFDRALQSCRFSGEHRKSLVFKDSKGNTYRRNITCPLIGADGAGSRLRYALRDAGALSFREELCSQGYKEVSFQKNDKMLRSGLHIWPRGGCYITHSSYYSLFYPSSNVTNTGTHFLMGLANLDGTFTGTIYADDLKGLCSSPSKIRSFFRTYYKDAIPLLGGMNSIVKEMTRNPTGLLGTSSSS